MRALGLAVLCATTVASAQTVSWTAETASVPSGQIGEVAVVRPPKLPPILALGDISTTGAAFVSIDGFIYPPLIVGAIRGIDSRGPIVAIAAPFAQSVYVLNMSDAGQTPFVPEVPLAAANAVALAVMDGGLNLWVDLGGGGDINRYRLFDGGAALVEQITIPGAPLDLVFDDRSGRLYASTALGIYRYIPGKPPELLIDADAGRLGGIPRGMALYSVHDGGTLLVTSVPLAQAFTVHGLTVNGAATYLGRFQVVSPQGTGALFGDSVAIQQPPAVGFDAGFLVVTDSLLGNAKLVPWDAVARAFTPPLAIEPLPFDAGTDAGLDAGADAGHDGGTDGGLDAGADAGQQDGGPGGGAGGGTAGTGGGTSNTGGGRVRTGGGAGGGDGVGGGEQMPGGCTCAQPDVTMVPLVAGLWWLGALRRRRTRSS